MIWEVRHSRIAINIVSFRTLTAHLSIFKFLAEYTCTLRYITASCPLHEASAMSHTDACPKPQLDQTAAFVQIFDSRTGMYCLRHWRESTTLTDPAPCEERRSLHPTTSLLACLCPAGSLAQPEQHAWHPAASARGSDRCDGHHQHSNKSERMRSDASSDGLTV